MTAPEPFGTYAPSRVVLGLLEACHRTPLGRGSARKLAARLVRSLHQGPIDVRLFGQQARLELHGNNSETKALLKPSLYARTAQAVCRDVLSGPAPVLVDIGANAGLFSLMASSGMTSGTLVAIEPQPALFARLQTNLEAMNPGLATRLAIRLFACAAGPQEGEIVLNIPGQLGQASVRPIAGASLLTVPVRPLASLLDEAGISRIDLLKIDVEGYEDDVLFPFFAEGPETLWPRAVVMEHCHKDRWKHDCAELLVSKGYHLSEGGRTDSVFRRAGEG